MVRRWAQSFVDLARRFSKSPRGNVAVIFSLALVPLLGMTGAAVDFARAARAKEQLRTAVDAATLATAQAISLPSDERRGVAYGALQANLAASMVANVKFTVTDTSTADGSGVVIEASGDLPTSFMNIFGVTTLSIATRAEAFPGSGAGAEVALVLDNTGSMINDMPALKAAASTFVNTVFRGGGGANMKMSVVPYVAVVNVGANFPPSALELTGTVPRQGSVYRINGWLAYLNGCQIDWGPPPPPAPPAPPPPAPPPIGSPTGQDTKGALEPSPLQDWFSIEGKARGFAQSLFGVSRAAADVTANSIDPIQTHYESPPWPYIAGQPFTIPNGGYQIYGCTLGYYGNVSNLELFNRMPGTKWKGCVEARTPPNDVSDDPPSASNKYMNFVPYFAPDEPDTPAAPNGFRNNYLSDWHASWGNNNARSPGLYGWNAFGNLFKYDMVNVPTVVETPPTTKGPNANCPDPLLRLTNDKAAILAKINSLNYWQGGGTISSEGLMWGWRTLSPNAPFADGSAYATINSVSGGASKASVKKHIVLMTDGLNSLVENYPNRTASAVLSDYTAYGFLQSGYMGSPASFAGAEAFLNERMKTACANAKAKGIIIHTILFRETDQKTKDLLAACASTPGQALVASDAASLYAAFSNIGSQIGSVRLTK